MIIREIKPEDNEAIASVIRNVFDEMDIPKTGTAYEDVALDCMYETYKGAGEKYYVVVHNGSIIGGAGIGKIAGDATTCELQKMYFLKEARGLGVGSEMMEKCLQTARDFNYKACYLETLPFMKGALKLYEKYGFAYLDAPMGCTGHTTCDVWMLKTL